MQKSSEKLHLFFIFTVISAVFFLIGLIIVFSLPSDSLLYEGLEKAVADFSVLNSYSDRISNVNLLISSFFDEIKYLLFAFVSCFTVHRYKIFIILNSYRGLLSGIGCSLFLRTLILNEPSGWLTFVSSIVFIAVSVCFILVLCYFCTLSLLFSRKIIYPIKLVSFFKRKDTYSYIFDFLAFCGVELIITFLKIGNLLFIIS